MDQPGFETARGHEQGAWDAGAGGIVFPASPARLTGSLPLAALRPPHPFVWQHGSQLLLLDDEPSGWVLAELKFDAIACRYVEIRRAAYDFPREAFCALISRAMIAGPEAAEDASHSLDAWIRVVPNLVMLPFFAN